MLVFWTLGGVVVGIALGAGLYSVHPSKLAIEIIGYPGELLINALQELVLPLIVLALMTGVLNLRHTTTGTGRITTWSLCYYLLSMVLAVIIGIALSFAIRPGRDQPFASGNNKCSTQSSGGTVESLLDIGRQLVPKNIIMAAATSQYLGVIMFAIVLAVILNSLGPPAEPFIRIIEIANDAIMAMIYLVIYCTPVGIASLIAQTILKACNITALLKSLGLYVGTILIGFGIHAFVALPLTIFILTRINPYRVMKAYFPAFAMGFGTSSSAATMPVTMECGVNLKCRPSIVRFVIPLGTNINRDGAALYEAASVLFIAQANGLVLSAGNVVVVAITATLAAIGSASIPNSALVSMVTVLQAVGMSQYIPQLAILLAMDWLIGMFRTITNIWGDACAVSVVDHFANKYAPDPYSRVHTIGSMVMMHVPCALWTALQRSGLGCTGFQACR
ncbi:Sodium:dicarboxylate symporter [Coccomyxa subellipsoidea C-169]|uniref:Amino acid transporter n=1 Tax=Coccomyxa subellipsoidea (strain C-169) TaxID=574566 RepID=I0YUH5_COCSC|nr:Sodium:dicarboxylate symporter [Coccomyxa subellipsoidea C-169]EIE22044.1 Sodium:dicarboxylate symporter [Coccomyxa subellipsoidea C-169]|eukprot:XP_005646588.1 Sodium:dicarboxylate symporter [Coccomyxa subellipsoidea C-169]